MSCSKVARLSDLPPDILLLIAEMMVDRHDHGRYRWHYPYPDYQKAKATAVLRCVVYAMSDVPYSVDECTARVFQRFKAVSTGVHAPVDPEFDWTVTPGIVRRVANLNRSEIVKIGRHADDMSAAKDLWMYVHYIRACFLAPKCRYGRSGSINRLHPGDAWFAARYLIKEFGGWTAHLARDRRAEKNTAKLSQKRERQA